MKWKIKRTTLRYNAPVIVCLLLIGVLLLLPTGYEDAVQYQGAERCVAEVMAIDNSSIIDTGLVRTGEQRCTLLIQDGQFQGQTVTGVNMLQDSLEQDKVFAVGDKAQVVISHTGDDITYVTMIDHYRISWELVLAGGFGLLLILFAGRTGLRVFCMQDIRI